MVSGHVLHTLDSSTGSLVSSRGEGGEPCPGAGPAGWGSPGARPGLCFSLEREPLSPLSNPHTPAETHSHPRAPSHFRVLLYGHQLVCSPHAHLCLGSGTLAPSGSLHRVPAACPESAADGDLVSCLALSPFGTLLPQPVPWLLVRGSQGRAVRTSAGLCWLVSWAGRGVHSAPSQSWSSAGSHCGSCLPSTDHLSGTGGRNPEQAPGARLQGSVAAISTLTAGGHGLEWQGWLCGASRTLCGSLHFPLLKFFS